MGYLQKIEWQLIVSYC